MMELQQKILDAFIGKVVRKDLAFLVKGGLPVPTYVLEYLLGQYCASDDEEIINDGLEKVTIMYTGRRRKASKASSASMASTG